MAEVKLQEGETLENALRRFKRKVLAEDIIKEVKRHAFYLKPGQKLRVKQALARKRKSKRLVGKLSRAKPIEATWGLLRFGVVRLAGHTKHSVTSDALGGATQFGRRCGLRRFCSGHPGVVQAGLSKLLP